MKSVYTFLKTFEKKAAPQRKEKEKSFGAHVDMRNCKEAFDAISAPVSFV